MPIFSLFGGGAPQADIPDPSTDPASQAAGQAAGINPQDFRPHTQDYLLDLLFRKQTPDMVNQQARLNYFGALMAKRQMDLSQAYQQAYSQTQAANQGQGQPGNLAPAAPMAQDQGSVTQAAPPQTAPSPMANNPFVRRNFNPTAAQLQPLLMAQTAVGMDPTKSLDVLKAGSPNIEMVNGTAVDKNDPAITGYQVAPAAADGVNYGYAPGGGIVARSMPGYDPVKNAQAFGAANVKNATTPPVPGMVLTADGRWIFPDGATAGIAADAAARASGPARYSFPNAPTDAQGHPIQGTAAGIATGGPGVPGGAPGAVAIPNSLGQNPVEADRAKAAEKNWNDIQADRGDAQSTINNLDRLNGLLTNMQSGKLAPNGNDIAGVAQSLGIPGDYRNLNNAQTVNAVNANVIGALKKQMGFTRLTDADLKFLNGVTPNNTNTPTANAQVINYMRALANRRVQRANAADNYVKTYGSLAAPGKGSPNFESAWSVYQAQHPLFGGKQ